MHLKSLELTGFKSFARKSALMFNAPISSIVGPNGSGKSNFTDAIRFVLGESSLKSLRAKKVRDLIHVGGTTAEVTLYFEGDEKIEIKRAIREDGKILYKLNGKKTTRMAILEAMRKHNLDESGRNIIAQGEVQRIINMSAKERRQIIDSVAGISDFEDKKNEAMRELGQVEAKINEANLVMGEKNAMLSELGREKEVAIQYSDHKKKMTNAKGTLLKHEIEKLDKDFTSNAENEKKINSAIKEKDDENLGVEAKIREMETRRTEISKELQHKQKTSELIRRIEELKAAISSKGQMIEDRENAIKKLDDEELQHSKEAKHSKDDISKLEKEIEEMKNQLKTLEAEAERYASTEESKEMENLSKNIETMMKRERDLSEDILRCESEISSKNELIMARKQEIESINSSVGVDDSEDERVKEEKESLKENLTSVAREIELLFQKEREFNSESASLDKKMLELREKHSILRVQTSPAAANPALRAIEELRTKGDIDGIYGTVAELIKFETKYTQAVEAAAGNRLLYVVVKDADTATKIIKHLKKTGSGRATFIPLREIRVSESRIDAAKSTNTPVSSVLKHSNEVKKAIDYVFGETLLMDSIEDAKKLGIGTARMVTLEGEVFERSGIISGGKVASSILAGTQLAKIESEINEVKETKNSIMRDLVSLREDSSRKRSEKAEIELKLKTLEIEEKSEKEKLKASEKILQRKKQLEEEVGRINSLIKEKTTELESSKKEQETVEKKLEEAKAAFKKIEEESKEQASETARKKNQLTASLSSTRAKVEGKLKELELKKNELFRKEERIKTIGMERKDLIEKINELKKTRTNEGDELSKSEEKISSTSKQIEKMFETMKGYEQELQKLGEARGKLRIDIDRLNKELGQLNVKKAITDTRLMDLKAEFDGYREFEELKMKKDELQEMVKSAEAFMAGIPNVNMASIEMYDKKKAEMDELQKNITTLDGERNAVVQMINEIDTRKKEAFFETFDAVSFNFRAMFDKINVGQGFLSLDNPNEPFVSGLHIKIRRNNRDHSIDSLSGGENSLVALMFIFSLQFVKSAPFYILDEVDHALDKENSKTLSQLIKGIAKNTQMIMVSHNDMVISSANAVLGVSRVGGVSKMVGVNLSQAGKIGELTQKEA
ncbi:MAG: chromosome segregation SMC family protein [Candidatus Micrarchaeia archaeon]